jgi:hypothetical protein
MFEYRLPLQRKVIEGRSTPRRDHFQDNLRFAARKRNVGHDM